MCGRSEPDDEERDDHVLKGKEQIFAVCGEGEGVAVCVGEGDCIARCFEDLGQTSSVTGYKMKGLAGQRT